MNKTFFDFLESQGLNPGCISEKLEEVSQKYLKKIMDAIKWGQDTDVPIRIGRKKYIAEVAMEWLEGDVDVLILAIQEYRSRYGNELLENMEW